MALLARGDSFAAAGDPRAAVSFYEAALKASFQSRALDHTTIVRLQGARQFMKEQVRLFELELDVVVDNIDATDSIGAARLIHALDMVKGSRDIFPQRPSMFYYPYLAQRQFFEPEEFDWASDVEAATDDILEELHGLLSEGAHFQPYVEDNPNRPTRDFHGLNNSRAWTALYVWKHGQFITEMAKRCPATVRAIEKVPLSHVGERTPSVFFSKLEPGAHIPQHTGMLNSRLICHLPL